MRRILLVYLFPLLLLFVIFGTHAEVEEPLATVTVRAPRHAYRNAVTVAVLPLDSKTHPIIRPNNKLALQPTTGGPLLPCQAVSSGEYVYLTFIVPALAEKQEQTYFLRRSEKLDVTSEPVRVTTNNHDVDVMFGKSLFTRYLTQNGSNKPFFYPLLSLEGKLLVRRWPLDHTSADSQEHPHNSGLWFAHGSVNGIDFSTDAPGAGKTINTGFPAFGGGPLYGGFRASTEWRAPNDLLIARDTRDIRFYPLPNGDRLMDFQITVLPVGSPIMLRATQEGTLGLRLAEALAPQGGGHIVNSVGDVDKAVWNKPASWVDYSGQIDGKKYGVAIFDGPRNLHHPQIWHAREYGLLAVSPFGLQEEGHGTKEAENYTIPPDGTLTLRYRLLFHQGDASTADVAGQYNAFADPPVVIAHW